jgi:hypothetical protein
LLIPVNLSYTHRETSSLTEAYLDFYLQRLPSAIVQVTLEPSRNQTLDATFKPHFPEQSIISLLVEEQLVVSAQCGVNFAVLVEVRSDSPCAVIKVEKEDHALADVDEKADVTAASEDIVSYVRVMVRGSDLLC